MQKKVRNVWFSILGFGAVATSFGLAFGLREPQNNVVVTDLSKVAQITQPSFNKAIDNKISSLNNKAILITAGGVVNDLSFNESVWDALSEVGEQTKRPENFKFAETNAGTASELITQYDNALYFGYKYWVLTGFQQANALLSWLQIPQNRNKFIERKIIVIGVDFTLTNAQFQVDVNLAPPGQFISINYKTQEPAWIVGYAAAKFVVENFPKNKWKISTFGGGPFAGVTNYNAGFLAGVYYWNKEQAKLPIIQQQMIEFTSTNGQSNSVVLDTGFVASKPGISATINSIIANGPEITLPVAGTLTSTTLNAINEANNDQMAIGVDTNQSIAFPNNSGSFFSSIEKNLGLTVYKTLSALYLQQIDPLTINPFFQQDGQAFVPVGTQNQAPSNINLDKGLNFADPTTSFVSFAASTLSGTFTQGINQGKTKAEVANADLQLANNLYKTLLLTSTATDPQPPIFFKNASGELLGPGANVNFLAEQINTLFNGETNPINPVAIKENNE